MKYLIFVVTALTSSSLFSMEMVNKSNAPKDYFVFKNLLPANDFNIPNPRVDLWGNQEIIKKITSKDIVIEQHLGQHAISLQPNEEIRIPLNTQKTQAAFALTFYTSMQNDRCQPLRLNANFGPLQFGDSIDVKLITYYKDEKAIGLFCNDELATFFPLRQKKMGQKKIDCVAQGKPCVST